jgi:1-acyl-sn-glycerol-3-phosphate acyltransferase
MAGPFQASSRENLLRLLSFACIVAISILAGIATSECCRWAFEVPAEVETRDGVVPAVPFLFLSFAGIAIGWPHAYRVLSFVVIGSLIAAGTHMWMYSSDGRGINGYAAMSVGAGLGFAAGGIVRHEFFRTGTRIGFVLVSFLVLSFVVIVTNSVGIDTLRNVYTYGTVLVSIILIVLYRRPLVELGFEIPTRILYRIRAHGPGVKSFPVRGPVLLIANHAAYTDPLFLASDTPRPITPMMTSKFYDKWLIYPIVKFVFGVIRVPDMTVKRSTPELDLAVQALDRGRCLVIFPEGYLQRKEDQPLRRFGRGVWEILKARPDTPVVAAWIEGSWGSFFSYKGGPPTKGKKPDFRRRIDVGYAEPFTVPKELLDDHWATRFYLMNKVGAARALVGQPRIPEAERPKADEEPT